MNKESLWNLGVGEWFEGEVENVFLRVGKNELRVFCGWCWVE